MEPIRTDRNGQGRFIAGESNKGRPPGPNHLTKTVKDTVLAVFNEIQSDPDIKLLSFAKKYPRDFYQIAAKLIPTDIKADITALFQIDQIVGMKLKDAS